MPIQLYSGYVVNLPSYLHIFLYKYYRMSAVEEIINYLESSGWSSSETEFTKSREHFVTVNGEAIPSGRSTSYKIEYTGDGFISDSDGSNCTVIHFFDIYINDTLRLSQSIESLSEFVETLNQMKIN